eukprot:scaffold45364_cov86-Phaeocystis_antarctica.AAC.2
MHGLFARRWLTGIAVLRERKRGECGGSGRRGRVAFVARIVWHAPVGSRTLCVAVRCRKSGVPRR